MPKHKNDHRPPLKERGPMPAIILTIICAVCVALLALTATVTSDAREAQAQYMADLHKRSLFPDATLFEDETLQASGEHVPGATVIDVPNDFPDVQNVIVVHEGDDVVGVIIQAATPGYAGKVPVMVGFNLDGAIEGIVVDAAGETPSLGQNTAEPDFTNQFAGRDASDSFGDIDAVTNATISSNSVVTSVGIAADVYTAMMKGAK
ncbi:MAG: FMN-binding protein [Saccharofermentanales bacterium]|jgi:RnfABCDGE-type electron transport complex G subunit